MKIMNMHLGIKLVSNYDQNSRGVSKEPIENKTD